MLFTIASFVVVFSVLVLAHETGHFIAAKRAGIRVEEFGLGFPPRLATIAVRDGTRYTLNALPLGGFVRMLGEEDPSAPDSFARQSLTTRLLTLSAGPLMNLLLAILLATSVYLIGEPVAVGKVVIHEVAPASPAEAAGLRPDDVIVAVEGTPFHTYVDMVNRIKELAGQEISLTIERGTETLIVRVTPRVNPPPGQGALGVSLGMKDYVFEPRRQPIWTAISKGFADVGSMVGLIATTFEYLFQGQVSPQDFAGPVGIMQMTGIVARSGIISLIRFAAFLSVNFFVFNLLPIPGLDGGRVLFIIVEGLRGGKRIAPEKEGFVHFIGLLALVALMLLISYFDVMRFLQGGSPLP
ncbi:MAG: RIP metalloprotease RseP [Chloroflexi bacterium]|nr:RIP metalloprotease RseP [Chloroflexota bacterium]